MTETVRITEVGPRDGLQNEPTPIATADKVALIDRLSATGLTRIEAAAFVSPKAVPQMADGAEVLAGIARAPGVTYAALTPNLRGYAAARAAGADEVAVFASASQGFSQANLGCSVAESLERFRPVAEAAKADRRPLRAYVSCVIACPYDGPTDPSDVATVMAALLDMGAREVSLGDTIGVGTPENWMTLLDRLTPTAGGPERLALHCHDTNGRALDCLRAGLVKGIRSVDASVGGLGGCPFAPGASGNVATEAVVAMLTDAGYATGVDPATLADAAAFARGLTTMATGTG